MLNNDFISTSVGDGTEMDAYVSFPESGSSLPIIILLQEAFGVNSHIRSIAQKLSRERYAVIAPDLFHRTVKRIEINYTDFASIAPHFQAIKKETLKFDLEAVYNWAKKQNNLNINNLGSLGFCLGGRVSFLANAFLPLKAGISYYGGGIDLLKEEVTNLHSEHLFFWGGKDQHITKEKRESVIEALDQGGKDYVNCVISNADHGFNCDERPSFNLNASREAWSMSMAFLSNHFNK